MNRIPDTNVEKEDVLLRELGKSVFPDQERFQKNLFTRLEIEHIRHSLEEDQVVAWRRKPWFRFAYAAVFLVMVMLSGTYWYYSSTKAIATVAVALGDITTSSASSQDKSIYPGDIVQSDTASQASLLLSDRSLIRLDEQSSLKMIERRKIKLLEGRLFAEIARTPQIDQFQIDTKNISIIVLGTSFEVDAQEEQNTVTVYQGSVRVEWSGQSKTLTKGDSLSISTNNQSSQSHTVKTDIPVWLMKLRQAESNNPIIQEMQKHFPSRSLNIKKSP